MASNEKRMTPMEIEDTKERQEDEQHFHHGLVQVKFSSRPRRRVFITTAVVIVVVIVASVLIGTFVSSDDNDNGKNITENNFSDKETGEDDKETESIRTSSMEAMIVKSSLAATKSSEVTHHTLPPFHETTTPHLKMTSTSLISLPSYDIPNASTIFSERMVLSSNTIATAILSSLAKLVPSTEELIVESSPSATKSSKVTYHTPPSFHETTTPHLRMTSTSLVSLPSYDIPNASTIFSERTVLSSNTIVTAALSSLAQLVPNAEAKWSRWSSWSECSKSCGNGTRHRKRNCVSLQNQHVNSCVGKDQQNQTCADWNCPDCDKICVKGTLNGNCDACTCGNHVLSGRVQTRKDAPLSEAKISLAETPYRVLAQTNATGFFTAYNVCADANQKVLISKDGFVPMKIKPTVTTSTTANIKAKLEKAVPPTITVQPQSKMRVSGHGVTFCCDGEGNPEPKFEWFKDNNIIDIEELNYNKTLEISNVSGLKGRYQCRVVNDFGSELSEVAYLQVFNTSNEASCNPTPQSKVATLPPGCVIQGTTNNTVDVGQCSPKPCFRNDSTQLKTACQDEKFCCVVEEVEDVTITCGGAATFNISKVVECGCQACAEPKTRITGLVVGLDGRVEKPVAYCEMKIGEDYYTADDKGLFSMEVPDDRARIIALFMDTFDNKFADFTKVFRVKKGQTLYSKIVLRLKPTPKPFNSSEPFDVPLGDEGGYSGFGEIKIPNSALLNEDGTAYSGPANLRLSLLDPRNMSDIVTAPGDFSTINEDGEEQMLVTYGMITLNFEDDSGKKLSTSKSIKMFLDPEKLNISVDSNGNTTAKLWWLDEATGRWIEAGPLWTETKQGGRKRRSSTRFLVTEITPVIQRQGPMNIDVRENFGAVRVFAPVSSTIRVLCREPSPSNSYAGYLEEAVDGFGVTCISVWINRDCFMQGEGSDARFLIPQTPDSFPNSVGASIVQSDLSPDGNSPSVRSFSFQISTDNRGPVYPHYENDLQNCRAPDLVEGHRQFEFENTNTANLNLISNRPPRPQPREPLSWCPVGSNINCFIKILINGSKGSVFLAASYRANSKDAADKFGDSVAKAESVNDNAYVACLEVRCPGNVYQSNSQSYVPEWTHVLVTHLTGTCDFQANHIPSQEDIDNQGTQCPSRSKRHSAGFENWFCIPLPTGGGFDLDRLFTATPRRDRNVAANRCRTGNNKWNGGDATPTTLIPTIEFSCS